MIKKLIAVALTCCLVAAVALGAASMSQAAGENDLSDPGNPAETAETTEPVSSEQPADTEEEPKPAAPPPLTLETVRMVSFQDVSAEDPRADCICYAAYEGLLSGVSEEKFDPDGLVTMASALTALYRMSGDPAPAYNGAFSDVPAGKWYTDAVAWGAEKGIVSGGSDGALHPLEPLTRVQLAAILYRYAAGGEGSVDAGQLSGYTDAASVPDYAVTPVAWALENRIFTGMISDTIHPKLPVSRAQLAQVLTAYTAWDTGEPVAMALTTQASAKIMVSTSQENHDEIQLLVDRTASKYGAEGLQVAVVEDGRVTDAYTYGYAVKNSVPMTTEHKIRAASITKVGVGMAAMLLREQGVINLDQDISTYWGVSVRNPKYPNDPITFRTLLTHTSSIRAFEDTARTYSPVRAQISSASGFSAKKPGDIRSWNYNNYGFVVLGMTLELASGQYLDTVMDKALWDIMDIDAAFEGGRVERTDLIANLYYNGGGLSRSATTQKSYLPKDTPGGTGAFFPGGLTISAKDLAKMAALLANDGYYEGLRLMKPESVELMETRNETILSDGTYQALPLRCQDWLYGRERIYYHTGSAYGVYNLFSYDPAAKDGVVVLTVGASGAKDNRNIYAVCSEISDGIYKVLEIS